MNSVTNNAPVCRHCGQPMRSEPQVFHYEKDGVVKIHREFNFIDCQNEDCPLWMQTFDDTQYAGKDLSVYMKNDGDTEPYYPKGAA